MSETKIDLDVALEEYRRVIVTIIDELVLARARLRQMEARYEQLVQECEARLADAK